MRKVSIIIPSLGRPDGLKRCLDSIKKLNYPQELIETIVIEDEPRLGVPKRVNEGVGKSVGDLIVYGSNDIEFMPDSLKLAVEAMEEYDLVAFNTGKVYLDEGNINEHFIIKRDFITDKLGGKLFDEDFNHVGVDNLLWVQAKRYGKAKRLDTAIVNHYHWTKGADYDEVYKIGWEDSKVIEDRKLLQKKIEELRYKNDIEGMMSQRELEWLYEKAKEMDSICEIGSWMGRSTHALLSGCKGGVYSVDHFLGSADPIETGNRDVYPEFIKNVGSFKNLKVHRMSSLEGSKKFEDKSLDMVFIDGGHQYSEVVEDITIWKSKAKKMLCGHDYHSEPVAKAVNELLGRPEVFETIWFFRLDNPLYQLKERIKQGENFNFVKMGDGEMSAMLGAKGQNCDGQQYSKKLGEGLKKAYKMIGKVKNTHITKWKLGMEKERKSLEGKLGIKCEVNHDLLLNRVNELSVYHYNFWKAIKNSSRKKIFVGPKRLEGVVKFLNIDDFIEIPEKNSYEAKFHIKLKDNAIILFSAGMPSKIWISKLLKINPNITCIDCGSAFDPIFVGQTRTNQALQSELKDFYKDLIMNKAKISVVVIAKNEEKTLPKLIESCRGVDEILVCDTGSTDNTVEVSKSLGARVVQGDFRESVTKEMADTINALPRKHKEEPDILKEGEMAFNFAKARNWAASQAKNDIIFMPDCDEIVEWDLEEVQRLFSNADRLEYNFIFAFDWQGKPLIQFIHSKFYDRRKYYWTRVIHEVLVPKMYTNKIEGWMSDMELNFLHELSKQFSTIAEIGSWKGKSTNALLEGCKGTVTAVDHFKGSADEKDGTHGGLGVYEQFLENTKQFNNLKVVKSNSDDAVKEFPDQSFEMVFIDGGHTYEEVKKDIELWQPKASKIICGHDYCDAWPEVKRAVDEKMGKVMSVDSIWFKIIDNSVSLPDISFKSFFTDKILLKHYQNPETSRTQYLKGLAIDNYQNEYNDRNAHYYARELMYRGYPNSAIEMFQRHIDNQGWNVEQGQSFIFMGNCYEKLGKLRAARQCYLLSIEREANRREAYLSLAHTYYDQKAWIEAERFYRLALSIPKTNYYANTETNYGHYPLGQLSVCLFYLGRKDESKKYLEEALLLDPNNEIYLNNLKFY